jgi:hypothetical protein
MNGAGNGDANAKVGRETVHQPTIDKHSLHESTNKNGLRLVDFAAGRQITIKSTYFMHKPIHLQTWHSPNEHTFNQIDHRLIDGRHFSDVIDVIARRGANIDSDHMLVVIKLKARICRASNKKPQQLRRFAVHKLKDRDVASWYYDGLESELQGVQPQLLSLDEKCKKLEETIQRVATNTIGYTRKQVCFEDECTKENEEKNAAREQVIQRGTKNAYKLARTNERRLFRITLNHVRRPFEPQVAMCRAKNGELLTNNNQVLARWKEHFEEHLKGGSESEQPTRPVDLKDDGVDIVLPSREEIEGVLIYLKNNKATGADSIAAKLLKNVGPNLVDTLHEVI